MSNYTIHSIFHIAKADFLQRVRSHYFLIAIGVCVFLIYSFVPPIGAGYRIISLGNYRGFYNAAWIGGMVANCTSFFALIGFYVVNYSVQRDYDTGVGQIIATTRISKIQYLLGKLSSNFAVLFFMLLVIAVMTLIMFFVRGETSQFELGKLLLPLFILGIPAMFIVAAIAVFLDSQSRIARGMINILYFFLFVGIVGGSMISPFLDIFSTQTALTQIKESIALAHPDWNGSSSAGLIIREWSSDIKTFTWEGMQWDVTFLGQKIFWMLASFGLVLLSSLGFKKFDTSKIKERKVKTSRFKSKKLTKIETDYVPSAIKFKDAPLPKTQFSFIPLLKAELRMMLKGHSNLWLLFTAVLFILLAVTPIDFAYKIALPLLWFFQVLIISKLGSREITNRCSDYIFASAFPLLRQLPATFASSTFFLIALALPLILRLVLAGNFYGVYAILIGGLFISVTAIALGILTGGSKLFEVLFAIVVYGHFNGIPYFDFVGASMASRELHLAHYLLGISFILILLAYTMRKRQLNRV